MPCEKSGLFFAPNGGNRGFLCLLETNIKIFCNENISRFGSYVVSLPMIFVK